MPLFAGHTRLADLTCDEFKRLIDEVVNDAIARAAPVDASSEFIGSRSCAALLNITPEHLCAMRARGEGPPWSGEGKWVRYRRDEVVAWLTNLPRKAAGSQQIIAQSDNTLPTDARPP